MKKIAVNIIIICCLATMVLYLYDRLVFFGNQDIKEYSHDLHHLKEESLLSLGNSQGLRLKWGMKNQDRAAGLCLAGADLFGSAEVLDVLKNRIAPSQIVFFNLNNISLYVDTKQATDSAGLFDFDVHAAVFYYALPFGYAPADKTSKFIKSRFYLINSMNNFEQAFATLLKVSLPARLYARIKENKDKTEQQKEHIAPKLYDGNALSQKASKTNSAKAFPRIRQVAVETIKKMAETAKEHHFTLIFYSCPVTGRCRDIVGPDVFDAEVLDLKSVMQQVDAPYFDHLADPEFTNNPDLFYDCAHLNTKGARCFDQKLFKEVSVRYPQFSSLLSDLTY